MGLRLYIFPSVTGLASMQRYILAPEERTDVEVELSRITSEAAAANPRFEWTDIVARLTAAGFVAPDSTWFIEKPWDDARKPVVTCFYVEFPSDAPHEHAGKRLTATTAVPGEDGLPLLLDEHGQLLQASDRLWSANDDGLAFEIDQVQRRPAPAQERPAGARTQVPLGPVIVPQDQFATPEQAAQAVQLLRDAHFEVQAA